MHKPLYEAPFAEVFILKPLQLLASLSTEAEFEDYEEGGEI